jgi:nitrate/TMAO reductase-like tetraheme cytochrome c subunit
MWCAARHKRKEIKEKLQWSIPPRERADIRAGPECRMWVPNSKKKKIKRGLMAAREMCRGFSWKHDKKTSQASW